MTTYVNIGELVKATQGKIDLVVRKIVIDLGTRLVYRSPVGDAKYWKNPPPAGYVGGRFRGNWQYGFGQSPSGDLPDIDTGGNKSIERVTNGALNSKASGLHYIVNNLPYAEAIENGHSKNQAPQGVVALTVMELENSIRKAVE